LTKIGVDIIQPMVPPYRSKLFSSIANDPRFNLSLQCSSEWPTGQPSIPLDIVQYYSNKRTINIGGSSALWQTKLELINAKGPGDVLVVCGDLHYLSNLPLIARARMRGVSILWWSHHASAGANPVRVALRLALAKRLSDCFLAYTESGVKYLADKGFREDRLFALGNTIDITSIDREVVKWDDASLDEFRTQAGVRQSRILLFCSVLNPKTRLEQAIHALSLLEDSNAILVVIGDGPMRKTYENVSAQYSVARRIRWLGDIRSQSQLAPWFLSASLFVYPGVIGLSLLHAFAYGLPVITHDNVKNHMPEIEALIPGVNGATFSEDSPLSLSTVISECLNNDSLLKALSKGAWNTAHNKYTMENAIKRFKDAILHCSNLSRIDV
jgi:glycosyltransferase involved in cell wall biosynthesis